jgi:hypothetical protein
MNKLLKPYFERHSRHWQIPYLQHADSLLIIEITEETNIGGIVLDPEWHQLGEIRDYPKDIPLWKSPQYEVGSAFIYPWHQYYSDTDCIWMANEFHPLD